jgi:hypothetical protein
MTTKIKITILISINVIIKVLSTLLVVIKFPAIMDAIASDTQKIEPKIKYAEFPIKIEYTLNGEHKIAENLLICEFKEIVHTSWLERVNTGVSSYSVWDSKFEDNQNVAPIILFDNNDITIDYSFGSAGYYMNDNASREIYYPGFRVFEPHPSGERVCTSFKTVEELENYILNKYEVEIDIINCVLPAPIANSFS